ncbi:hypothetical protein FRC19_008386 [Serendipita sp. 401]|nr:hypothetical protein FRC15_011488 [Serendipita sp. 397]KAG8828270.1 hypothetical protein FRC19_008386 [Serendipita sp. 401]KAG8845613.1 hypothetical protein FRC20_003148 [Serendipita sp. 405]KAG9058764.1 hypothetical protein FS842_003553 [Serendipita sp. 407]
MYHPDTTTCRDAEVAEARFHAIHNAYNTILRRSGSFKGTRDDPVDTEADEIRKRLAAWKAAEAHRGASFYNQERRRRALEAENSAGKWWKSDRSIFYLLGGTTIAMILVQIQGHSVSTQRQKVKKYLELQKGSRSEQGDKP